MRGSLREQPISRSGSLRWYSWVVLTASVALALAACGGGGGGGSDPPAAPVTPPPPPPPPPPSNAAPVVAAGADQTVELPFKASLSGSATDDGTPTPASLTYAWTGPAGVTFDAAANAATQASFPNSGTFVLTLTVSDGASSGTDAVSVTVNPAVFPAASDDALPDQGWTRVAAADVGMNQALLDQATTYAQSGRAGAGSGMIVRRGRVVHSWGNIDERMELKSVAKSIGGVALGLAIDAGQVRLSDTAITHMPTIGTPPDANAVTGWLPQITVLQLAAHTAGFDKDGGYSPILFQPGTAWSYSDAGLNWLADMLTTLYNRDLRDVMEERVWGVIGLTRDDIVWRSQAVGKRRDVRPPTTIDHRELAAGIIANANAAARLGLLFLRRGVWADRPRILSEEFIDTVRVPHPEVARVSVVPAGQNDFPAATQHYGVLWWTNADGTLPNVPRDAYWAWGLFDSLIVVIPSLDIVVARVGVEEPEDSPTARLWNDFDWTGQYEVLAPFLDPIVASTR